MQSTDIPAKVQLPFAADAASGFIRTIPVTTSDPAAASYTLGFPPNTALQVSAGGTPPDIRDFNDILKVVSAWSQWQGVGGPVFYDAAIAANNGGYPKSTILTATSVANAWWLNLVQNNVTDPDTGGAGWLLVNLSPGQALVGGMGFIAVISNSVASPPPSPSDGDRYLVPVGATGGWIRQDNNVAQWSASLGAWVYFNFATQWMVGIASIDDFYQRNADGTWSSIFYNDVDSFFLGMMGG
jgi:hypothetical protein